MDMGGFGSGRHSYATTPTVADCFQLDVNDFTRVVKHPGESVRLRWGDPDDPACAVVAYAVEHENRPDRAVGLGLMYTATDPRAGTESTYRYAVPLEYTACHFGGSRPWFRCNPRTPDSDGVEDAGEGCGSRVGKLYLPPQGDVFRCRECHGLGYTSSRASGNDLARVELRFRKAFADADACGRRPHPNDIDAWIHGPERPKGMHRSTFEGFCAEVRDARRAWNGAVEAKLSTIPDSRQPDLE